MLRREPRQQTCHYKVMHSNSLSRSSVPLDSYRRIGNDGDCRRDSRVGLATDQRSMSREC